MAKELSRRLVSTFLNDAERRRPVFGGARKFQEDPHWHDCILFYEYFHGDNGAGIGASHQTGWTGIVAKLIELFAYLDPDVFLETRDFLRVSALSKPKDCRFGNLTVKPLTASTVRTIIRPPAYPERIVIKNAIQPKVFLSGDGR